MQRQMRHVDVREFVVVWFFPIMILQRELTSPLCFSLMMMSLLGFWAFGLLWGNAA